MEIPRRWMVEYGINLQTKSKRRTDVEKRILRPRQALGCPTHDEVETKVRLSEFLSLGFDAVQLCRLLLMYRRNVEVR
jgi:hypothetical protein